MTWFVHWKNRQRTAKVDKIKSDMDILKEQLYAKHQDIEALCDLLMMDAGPKIPTARCVCIVLGKFWCIECWTQPDVAQVSVLRNFGIYILPSFSTMNCWTFFWHFEGEFLRLRKLFWGGQLSASMVGPLVKSWISRKLKCIRVQYDSDDGAVYDRRKLGS